ncbi:type I-U CRISPR-associated RAMP protein Csb1/Cas7u [Corynebacterium frankenforstense]|uniref:type I-G CRISPR-associated RAMP protein Csb1/Cas7g n=1 Tax=Corynebacterium TaxID=1716 RepID=UPI00254BCE05|nr:MULTISPECIES: type I-U CRISPR-associated RAMP protein Csb1/Cas7u [Corynebacterium]MDK6259691.1 type I-U CRISPR-associated RAMP protein Csb1/Cas7u [Corynebacterium frankenforstense]MDK8894875.1 type I-U CRISPR-associated RAMP protein Csb1/Cas7u [Corynebacterium sp. MSK006]
MSEAQTYENLLSACRRGGSSVLTSTTELGAAAGAHASIAPAKFVSHSNPTFAFETRYIDGQAQTVALIDGKQSSSNRGEAALAQSIRDAEPVASRIPRMRVQYEDRDFLCMELPHRAFDGHFRAATLEGRPATQTNVFQALRNCTPADSRALLETSPISLALGAWDATRAKDQVRIRSSVTGEIIGVLADQEAEGRDRYSLRGGARVDPVAMSVQLDGASMERILADQEHDLSAKTVASLRSEINKAKKEPVSASSLGLGGIPPSLDALGGVACSRIIRSWVLSFASLRQLRFGAGAEGDAACRTLLAALDLAVVARAEEELYLRANCDLVELSEPETKLDLRFGKSQPIDPITVDTADALLERAMDEAEAKAGIRWQGQTLEFIGNPAVLRGAVDESEEEA